MVPKLMIATVLAVIAIAVSGCGSDASKATPVTGPTASATPSAPRHDPTASTGTTGSVAPAGAAAADTGGTSPNNSPNSGGTTPNESGAGDEQAASSPVQIGLEGGKFTSSTPSVVHVPPFIQIALEIDAKDGRGYSLSVVSGKQTSVHIVKQAGSTTVPLEGLRPGHSLTVKLGTASIKVSADAEPGP